MHDGKKKGILAKTIYQSLIDISSAASTTFNLDELFLVIHRTLGRIIDVTNFSIAILDPISGTLSFPFFRDEMDKGYDSFRRFSTDDSLSGEVIDKRQPLLLHTEDLARRTEKQRYRGASPLIWLGVPLMIKNEVLGVMAVKSYTKPNLFTADDLEILTSISHQVAIAIDRKIAADTLRLSEEKFRSFVEGTDDLVVQMDKEGSISYCNHSVVRLLGETPEKCIKRTIFDFVHPEDVEDFLDVFMEILSRRRVSISIENRLINRQTGDATPLHWTINGQYDTCGQSVVVNGIARDLTNQKRAEEERLKVQKLESIAVLSGGIAHDFNNLLSVMLGNLDLLRDLGSLQEGDKEYVAQARKACVRAKELTLQLINFSQGDAPRLKPGNLRDVIAVCVKKAQLKTATTIDLDIDDDLWTVAFDVFQISHAVDNLLENAIEAVDGRGSIRVRLHNSTTNGGISPLAEDEPLVRGRKVVLGISDTGIGIQEEHRLRVFDPYFSTKSRGPQKGMGLGLSIAYAIVRRHQGEIRIWSEPGTGTVVRVFLPVETE